MAIRHEAIAHPGYAIPQHRHLKSSRNGLWNGMPSDTFRALA